MALVSVIVPVYKVEKYLCRCVDSILNQNFSDFELILVDDGSPDRCGSICDAYAETDARVYVIHQQNGGLSAARNAGLDHVFAHSNSEWITFIDSDDWVRMNYLQLLLDTVQQTNCKVAVCNYEKTDGCTIPEKTVTCSTETFSAEEFWINNRVLATIACCKLYHRSLFYKIRYPVGKLHEDEFTTYKILFACDSIAFIPVLLYNYYINPNSIMGQWTPKRAVALSALKEQCAFFQKNHYKNAELLSAHALFENCAGVLNNLLQQYPEEKKLIHKTRILFRYVRRKYKTLDYSIVGSKKNYMRLVHPLLTKLRKKCKHVLIFIRRQIHA